MKRIVCLCTLPQSYQESLSTHLMVAYDELRKFNIEFGIKGIFIIYKNTVLLVFEGDAKAVARAAYKARQDSQFKTFSLIVNCDIEAHYFNRWSIRLVKPESRSQQSFLDQLKKELEKDFKFESPKDRKLYEDIYIAERNTAVIPLPNKRKTIANAAAKSNVNPLQKNDLMGSAVSITMWPKPTQMKPTAAAMKTCSLISNRFVPYQTLLDRNIWPTESELVRFLNFLHGLGTLQLKVCHLADKSTIADPQVEHKPTEPDRFSQLIKRFITSPRSKAN